MVGKETGKAKQRWYHRSICSWINRPDVGGSTYSIILLATAHTSSQTTDSLDSWAVHVIAIWMQHMLQMCYSLNSELPACFGMPAGWNGNHTVKINPDHELRGTEVLALHPRVFVVGAMKLTDSYQLSYCTYCVALDSCHIEDFSLTALCSGMKADCTILDWFVPLLSRKHNVDATGWKSQYKAFLIWISTCGFLPGVWMDCTCILIWLEPSLRVSRAALELWRMTSQPSLSCLTKLAAKHSTSPFMPASKAKLRAGIWSLLSIGAFLAAAAMVGRHCLACMNEWMLYCPLRAETDIERYNRMSFYEDQ